MLLSSRQQLRLLIKPKSSKTIGLFLTAAAVVFSLVSVLRYNAKASEFLTEPVESRSLEESFMSAIEPDGLYQFSMSVVGVSFEYEVFELELVARGLDAKAVLRLKERNGLLQEYERSIDEAAFRPFWRSLRSLEVAQLSDLSPHTEAFILSLDSAGEKNYTASEVKQTATYYEAPDVVPSATYRFVFQDGLYDYPNSFEVYAPGALEDTRYYKLRDLAIRFAEETFDLSDS